jgi:hypothetical protein
LLGLRKQRLKPESKNLAQQLIICRHITIPYMKKFMYCIHNYTPKYLRILSGQKPDLLTKWEKLLVVNWTFSGPSLHEVGRRMVSYARQWGY